MNKKVNTLIFILCATLFNIITAIISFMVLTLLYLRFLINQMPETTRSWAFTGLFLLSIAASFLIYRGVIKYFINKIEIEKYFDPLFVRKHRKPKQEN